MTPLNSKIGKYIQMFVEQKRALGYPYDSSERILHDLDKMIQDKFPNELTITSDVIEAWINLKSNENQNGLLRRITPVRQLGKFMNGIGVSAYIVPGHIPERQIKYEAHIYTKDELTQFFKAIDSVQYNAMAPTRNFVIPVIFRYLYCCGMRSSEARLLSVNDVNLNTGKIIIRESKGWRARTIFMSEDLLSISNEYDEIMQDIIPDRVPFFPNMDGNYYSRSALDLWFHEFWDRYHSKEDIIGNSPRVHDFRHTYAVNRLNQWVKDGEEVQALYPYLSEYLGHAHFEDTDYYLKLSESFYPEMEKRMNETNEDILPEALNDKQ